MLADRLGMPHGAGSKSKFLLAFEKDLAARHQAGGLTSIVIDEAQSLTHQLFEELRLLANLETATAKLVNLILVGQPELADRLNDPSLRQLKQRVVLRCALEPLELRSTASYIAARLQVAGGAPRDIFTKDAIVAIYEASHGIPRTIGVVCENALLAGFAAQKKPIDAAVVHEVCKDLDLPSNGRPPRGSSAGRPASASPTGPAASGAQAPPGRGNSGRRWFSFGNAEADSGSSAKGEGAPAGDEGKRLFRFF
jgi:general secretion pathway protein A